MLEQIKSDNCGFALGGHGSRYSQWVGVGWGYIRVQNIKIVINCCSRTSSIAVGTGRQSVWKKLTDITWHGSRYPVLQ
jgi:hypothetical protein